MRRHAGARAIDHELHRHIQGILSGADELAEFNVAFGERQRKKGDTLSLFRHFEIGRGQNRIHRRLEAWPHMSRPMRLEDRMQARDGRISYKRDPV